MNSVLGSMKGVSPRWRGVAAAAPPTATTAASRVTAMATTTCSEGYTWSPATQLAL